jgi:hypothetical protein
MYIAPNGKLYTKKNRFVPVAGFTRVYLPFGIVMIAFACEVTPNLN